MSIRNVLRIEKKKRVSADTNITDAYKVPYGQSNVGSALDEVVYRTVATASAGDTFSTQIATLSASFASLTNAEKCRSAIKIGSALIKCFETNGIFSGNGYDPAAVGITMVNMSTAAFISWVITTGGTSRTDLSAVTNDQTMELVLI